MNKKILITIGILAIIVVLLGECIHRPKPTTTTTTISTECGNGICESGEDGFNCPVDCCVDGDGVCREGCTPLDDDDCEEVIDKIKIFSWAETKRTADGGYDADVFSTLFGAHIYLEFNHTPPKPEDIISFYDSRQAEDGSWVSGWGEGGREHWGPITAHTLMTYEALNATPTKSLDPFFEKIDTWGEVVDFTRAYHSGNFWGGIWGPIIAWYHYYGEDPPWWDDYNNAVKENRDTWEADTHQSSHVLLVYYQLGKPLPEFTVNSILESQEQDGGWSPGIDETGFALSILTLYYNNVEPLDSIIEAAKKAEPYVWSCYHETADYAWFTQTPSTKEQVLIKTWNGLFALKIINGLLYCGNGICEASERVDGFTCPEDCCVDGDGVCREGCTPKNDNDCETEVEIETIPDLMVGIHLEKAQDALGDLSMMRYAVNQTGCQLVSRGWDDHQFVKYSDYEDWSPVAQAVNDGGALFGAWQSVARIKRGFGGQDDLLTGIEFNDYTTRGADGKSYYTGDKWTYDGAINNEAYLDYLLAGTYAQIDAGADCIHYDEIGGGAYSSPEGKVGYDGYTLGIVNFCRPSSVIPTATVDSLSGQYIPANAIDGDTSTYWVSNEGTASHWLEIDLSTSRTIRQISLSLHPKYLLTSYAIQYWDGTDWINLVTETANPSNKPSYLVHPVSTTKIRLYTTQQHARVAEFCVFGEGFRQHLIEKYGENYDWMGKFKIDLTPGGSQCPDGTINSFNYLAYLADHGWGGHNYGKNNPRGSDPAYYPSSNPLYSEWDRSPSYMFWSDTKLGDCDTGVGKCAQSFVPSKDEEILGFHLYLKANKPSDDLIVEIQGDNNNSPSGEILASATVPGKNYSTQGHYKRHPILLLNLTTAKGVVIESGRKYWVVAHTIDGSSNEYLWQGSGDGAGAMQRLQGVWTPQPGGLFYEVWTAEDINTSFRVECVRRTIDYLYQHTREYGDAKGKTVYVTANGIVPSSDYNDVGMGCGGDLPRDDPAALRPHLDGTRVQISYWRQKKALAQHLNDVPTMMFLDYGFEGFPFQDLATQAEREAYLRIYVPEMYASGLLFSYPVKLGWGYKAYRDWNAGKTYTTYDAIVNQSRFLNSHSHIYRDVSINPMEEDVTVKVGNQWITPFNGDPLGEANEAKVSIALMDANDGSKIYLHVINHNWDSSAHRMREQSNIEIFIPLPSDTDITNINIISPDFSSEGFPIEWSIGDNGVYVALPSLIYYDIIIIEIK